MVSKTATTATQGNKAATTAAEKAAVASPIAVNANNSSQGSAIDALKQDHRRVERLFADYESAANEQRKEELLKQICVELIIHTKLEEELFYPACRAALSEDNLIDEAQVEHDSAKLLIADLQRARPDDRFRDAKVSPSR